MTAVIGEFSMSHVSTYMEALELWYCIEHCMLGLFSMFSLLEQPESCCPKEPSAPCVAGLTVLRVRLARLIILVPILMG